MRPRGLAVLLGAALLGAAPAAAHEDHGTRHGHAASAAETVVPAEQAPLPFRARFALTDHRGRPVTEATFRGRYLLVYFGYAACEGICPAALARLAAAVDLLGEAGGRVQPLLVTVDPERDTPRALAEKLPRIHPRLLGLTGDRQALAAARRSFGLRARKVAETPGGDAVYAHGSYLYLVGPGGSVLTLLPPVLDAERMAAIIRGYLS